MHTLGKIEQQEGPAQIKHQKNECHLQHQRTLYEKQQTIEYFVCMNYYMTYKDVKCPTRIVLSQLHISRAPGEDIGNRHFLVHLGVCWRGSISRSHDSNRILIMQSIIYSNILVINEFLGFLGCVYKAVHQSCEKADKFV